MRSGTLRLYDTRTGEKKAVKPLRNDNIIRMYICGPTVYDYSHIGHFKTFITYDSLVRLLKYLGYDVIHVVNITDIDDKIINRANEEGVTYRDISEKYTEDFLSIWKRLNMLPPYALPRATYHIRDMINIIEKLIREGYAYPADGNVYFSVSKFKGYGEISKQKIEELIRGYRVEEGPGKKDKLDFALWKRSKEGEPSWKSPWGEGRPGWHIECTAMSSRFLDPPFEIHGGGEDLKFPHHENERAQTNAYIGGEAVYIWMHVGILKFAREKMSKSLGNIITMKEMLKEFSPDLIRLIILSTHYRKQLEYSDDKVEEARNVLRRIKRVYKKLLDYREYRDMGELDIDGYRERFIEELLDDFNTASALNIFMSFIDRLESSIDNNKLSREDVTNALALIEEFKYIYGLTLEDEARLDEELLKLIVDVRGELRRRKIYEVADMIRDRLREMGIVLEDVGDKTIYYRI